MWRRKEGEQEKWYRHGNPTKKGGTTYNITTGVEIERPNKAIRVTLKSRSEKTWVFHKGAQRSTETAHKKRSRNKSFKDMQPHHRTNQNKRTHG